MPKLPPNKKPRSPSRAPKPEYRVREELGKTLPLSNAGEHKDRAIRLNRYFDGQRGTIREAHLGFDKRLIKTVFYTVETPTMIYLGVTWDDFLADVESN